MAAPAPAERTPALESPILSHSGPIDSLADVPRLLAALAPSERPTSGVQLMYAAAPFEPNPLIPTLIYGLSSSTRWEPLLANLRLALPATHTVSLLLCNAASTQAPLHRIGAALSNVEALFVPAVAPEAAERSLQGLRQLVHRLRAPDGCPWDREQTPESLLPFVLEEAYEVVDAVRHDGPTERAEELGDLLLQVFLQAEIAEEAGDFTLNDVVEQISAKLIRRHPHVFGDVVVASADEVERNWERLKGTEKAERTSVLDGVPRSLPALTAAREIQRRLKQVGFDWPDRQGVEAKLTEELAELRQAESLGRASEELGDVLFILTRLALDLGADAEEALRGTNARVAERFRYVEGRVRDRGNDLRELPLPDLLALWDEAKSAER